jgi:hypothetical protein
VTRAVRISRGATVRPRVQITRKITRILATFFDKHTVSRFVDHAQSILDAAESAGSCSEVTILLGPDGIRMIADSDWPLDSLLSHHAANTAYRVSENRGALRVEGREGSRRCVFESVRPSQTARLLLVAR